MTGTAVPEVDAQITVLHTMYLVMKCCQLDAADHGYRVFRKLFATCLESQPKVRIV